MSKKEGKMKKFEFLYLLITPAMIIIVSIVLIPIGLSVVNSFTVDGGGFGFDNYLYFFQDEIQRANIIYTLEVVVITVILCIGIAYLLSSYLRFSNSKVSKIIGNYIYYHALFWLSCGKWYDYRYSRFRVN